MKRVGAMLLALALLLTTVPLAVFASEGALTLAQLREKYPHGAYWNHTGTTNKPGGYTWEPCNHHGGCSYSGSCGCNSYNGVAIQCMGFAYQLASLAYDCDPRSDWSTSYHKTALDTLKPGDIVRYNNNGHSIFVIGVAGDTVTYADCNSDRHCKIKWDQTTTKEKLKTSFTYVKSAPYALENGGVPTAPKLTVQYHAGGGSIATTVTGYRYTVTDPDGVNMRSGAGTGNPVLTALPKGTEFTVKTGDTKTAGGYTWGKTTYDGTTGWVVISDFVKKTATLQSGDYYVEDALVYRTATNAVFTVTAGSGERVALTDPVTFGLKKEPYRFVGWSTQPSGAPVYAWDDDTLTAEMLYPALEQGSATVTLYAVWGCEHTYDNACDATCNRCGEERKTDHTYTAPCVEACTVCGARREAEPHTFVDGVCTACGEERTPLALVTQPVEGYAPMGDKVSVSVEAAGDGLTYQWYLQNEGQTKFYKSSVTTATYTATMSDKSKNRQVTCTVTDQYGAQVQTQPVFLREAVSLVTQPKTVTVAMGERAQVSVTAAGDGLTYQWYLKNAGQTKYYKSSVTTATYTTTLSDKSKGRRLICYVTDQYGNRVQSQTALLREAVSLVTQPKSVTVAQGKSARVTVEASGDGLTYKWYIKNAGSTKYGVSSITTATYSVRMSEKADGRRLICYVYDKYGNKVQTKTVMIQMK